MNSLHLELRMATALPHQALDALWTEGLKDRDSYIRYLLGMFTLAEALAPAPQEIEARSLWTAWFDRRRPALLHQDLCRLGVLPLASGASPLPASQWMGANYVLEGSALGARVLLRHAAKLQQTHPDLPRSFLTHHAEVGDRWPKFLAALAQLQGHQRDGAVGGAQFAFRLVYDVMAVGADA